MRKSYTYMYNDDKQVRNVTNASLSKFIEIKFQKEIFKAPIEDQFRSQTREENHI